MIYLSYLETKDCGLGKYDMTSPLPHLLRNTVNCYRLIDV